MNRQDWLNKVNDLYSNARYYTGVFFGAVKTYPKTSIAICVALAIAAAFYAGKARGAPLACDLTANVVTCPLPGAPPPQPAPVPTPIPQPIPVDPIAAACPSGTMAIRNQWGNTRIITQGFGTQTIVVEVKVPAAGFAGTKTSSWSEYGSAPTTREATLSTKPCDFTNANALRNGLGQYAHKSNVISFNFGYKVGAADRFNYGLTAGQTYYINIRNKDANGGDTCATGVPCDMIGGLPQ